MPLKGRPMHFSSRTLTAAQIAGISKFNVRRDHVADDAELDSLARMLAVTKGWLNPIVVVNDEFPQADLPDEPFYVLAGRRRWCAVNRAFDLELLPADMELRVSVFEGTPAEAKEISLMENIGHQPMTPVEEVCAFRDCAEAGLSPAEIAKNFGIEPRTVNARLALAHLHGDILEAWRAKAITEKVAQAYCSEIDPAKQLALWTGSPGIRDNASEIRKRLRGDAILATSALAVFVGAYAYQAAGGVIDGDLFESDVWWKDPGIARDLARQTLLAHGEQIKAAEGWGWIRTQFDADTIGLENFKEDAAKFTVGEVREIDEINAALTRGDGDKAENLARLAEVEAKGWTRGIAKARRAKLGILVQINGDGSEIEVDRALETKAMRESRQEKADRTPAEKLSGAKVSAVIVDEIATASEPDPHEDGRADYEFSEAMGHATAALARNDYDFAMSLLLVAFTRYSLGEAIGFEAAHHLPSITSELHRALLTQQDFREALKLAGSSHSDIRNKALQDIVACAMVAMERPHTVNMALANSALYHGFPSLIASAFDAKAYVAALSQAERDSIAVGTADLSERLPAFLHFAVIDAANDGAAVIEEDTRSTAQAMTEAIEASPEVPVPGSDGSITIQAKVDGGAVISIKAPGFQMPAYAAVEPPPLDQRFELFARACIVREPGQVKAQTVIDAYNAFASEQGWPTSVASVIGPAASAYGIEKHKTKVAMFYRNIALREPEGV